MTYVYLFVAFLAVGVLGSLLNRFVKPQLAGLLSVCGLSAIGIAMGVQSIMAGRFDIVALHNSQLGHVGFACDQLSAWFLVIVGLLFALGAFYGRGYLAHYNASVRQLAIHWCSFAVTLAGLLVLMTTENLISFLIGWEMMAVGSFFAVIFEYDKPQVLKAGLNYFIQSHVAVLLITTVFAWAMSVTGKTSFVAIKEFFAQSSANVQFVAMLMLIIGFGFKAGFVPFHSWLPFAHPAAPSHISALMSGVIVKAGIYGIVRFGRYVVDAQMPIGAVLVVVGIVSGLYGIVGAAQHRDFKRMLAYCTIENVGIIALGLGVGFVGLALHSVPLCFLGFAGALLHTLNHAVFKALLFFGAGNVYVSVHTRNMEELGGLGKLMPRTSFLFLVGCLAIGGLPPMGGFISELLIYSGFVKGFAVDGLAVPVLMATAGCALAVIGGVSMLAFTKTYGVIFLGAPRKSLPHEPHEVSSAMLWPGYALVAVIALVVFFAWRLVSFAFGIVGGIFPVSVTDADYEFLNGVLALVRTVSFSMLAFAAVILVMRIVRRAVASDRPVYYGPTWGCGYMKPIQGIQYTSKSFSKTLLDMCRFFLPTTHRFDPITTEEIFPTDRAHHSVDHDFVDHKVIMPGVEKMELGLDKFQFIQNGNLQRYIVYGLVYMLILIATIIVFN